MGQPARRSVILDRPSPPDEPASVVWANGEYAETVEDPLGGTGDPLPRLLGVERDPKWTAKLVPRGEVKVTGANAPGASETDPARAFGSPDVSVNVTRASGDDPSSANATAGSVFGAPSPSPSPAEAAKRGPQAGQVARGRRGDSNQNLRASNLRRGAEESERDRAARVAVQVQGEDRSRGAGARRAAPAVSADKTAGAVAGSFDESSIARVADSPATDPHDPNTSVVERGNWKMILPAELTASAVPGEAPPAVETSSSTSETSKSSGCGDSQSGDSPSGDSLSAPATDRRFPFHRRRGRSLTRPRRDRIAGRSKEQEEERREGSFRGRGGGYRG